MVIMLTIVKIILPIITTKNNCINNKNKKQQ